MDNKLDYKSSGQRNSLLSQDCDITLVEDGRISVLEVVSFEFSDGGCEVVLDHYLEPGCKITLKAWNVSLEQFEKIGTLDHGYYENVDIESESIVTSVEPLPEETGYWATRVRFVGNMRISNPNS